MSNVNGQMTSNSNPLWGLLQCLTMIFLIVTMTDFSTEAQEFPSELPWVNDTIYVAPSASEGGDGSLNAPYNDFTDFTFKRKTAYLFKRGDEMDIDEVSIGTDSIYVGAYGTGEKPHFHGSSTTHTFTFSGNHQYIQNLKVTNQDTGVCFRFRAFNQLRNKFLWADGVEARAAHRAIEPSQYGKIILTNIKVDRTRNDGIYASYNDTIIIRNAHVTDVNRWYYDIGNIQTSGGDCIQFEVNNFIKVTDSYLDHSINPGKFAMIANRSDTVTLKNSTLISWDTMSAVYLGSSERGWHVEKCKVKGGRIGLENHGHLTVKNTTIRNCSEAAITGGNTQVYHCTISDVDGKYALNGWGDNPWEVYNSIFYDINIVYGAMDYMVEASNNNYYNPGNEQPVNQWGSNVMNTDPQFVDYQHHNYDLKSTSPMIDAGLSPDRIKQDISGLKRPNGEAHDLGAHEYYAPGTEEYYEQDSAQAENDAPVLQISYDTPVDAGFAGHLDASESRDPNGDQIYYNWDTPEGIALSTKTIGEAAFLGPDVETTTDYDITLTITDGNLSSDTTVTVTVHPYKPQVEELVISAYDYSSYQEPNEPNNLYDNNDTTRWSSQGEGEYVILQLRNKATIDFIKLAYYHGNFRQGYFSLYGSNDTSTWEELLIDQQTSGVSEAKEVFEIPDQQDPPSYQFIKLVGQSNSENSWNSILELEVFGTPQEDTSQENLLPVIELQYESSVQSGFVTNLDASESYDPNNDPLNYQWSGPQAIQVIPPDQPKTSFMAPQVDEPTSFDIDLTLNDGQANQTETASITVEPYKPEVNQLTIESAEASSYQDNHSPDQVIDQDLNTWWSSQGNNEWVILTLEGKARVDFIKLAYFEGHQKEGYFDLQASNDKENWNDLLLNQHTSGISQKRQVFEIPSEESQEAYQYVKLIGFGTSQDGNNTVSEIELYGTLEETTALPENGANSAIRLYPNPAGRHITIEGHQETGVPLKASIYTSTGRLITEKQLNKAPYRRISLDLSGGLYYLKIQFKDHAPITKPFVVK